MIKSMQVTVMELVPSRSVVLCQEVSTRKTIEVRMLPLRVRLPAVGERWLIDRTFQAWTFAALLTSPTAFATLSTHVGATAPANPGVGDRWVPQPAQVWNGTAWVAE